MKKILFNILMTIMSMPAVIAILILLPFGVVYDRGHALIRIYTAWLEKIQKKIFNIDE